MPWSTPGSPGTRATSGRCPEHSLVRSKAPFLRPDHTHRSQRAQGLSMMAEGHRRRRREASLTGPSTMATWNGHGCGKCSEHSCWILLQDNARRAQDIHALVPHANRRAPEAGTRHLRPDHRRSGPQARPRLPRLRARRSRPEPRAPGRPHGSNCEGLERQVHGRALRGSKQAIDRQGQPDHD